MPFGIKVEITGHAELTRVFHTLKGSLQRKHLRRAMGKIGTELLRATKARLPKNRSGALRRSMGRKVATYGGVVVAIVGARWGFKTHYGIRLRDSSPSTKPWNRYRAGEPVRVDPTKYLHLVELGSKRSRARHMLRDAYAACNPNLERYLNEAMAAAIDEAVAKGGR